MFAFCFSAVAKRCGFVLLETDACAAGDNKRLGSKELCIPLFSLFASERTSLILPIYQRYNLLLCCVISCPSVDVNFSHLLLGSLSHFLM